MPVSITEEQAFSCCASRRWARAVATGGPYASKEALVAAARTAWWQATDVPGWLQAFAAHPKIGEKKAAVPTTAQFSAFSHSEQAAAASTTSDAVAAELASLNSAYADRYGFIFIICARGRSSPEILAELKRRLGRPAHEELQAAATEQMAITEMRLTALLASQEQVAAPGQEATPTAGPSGAALRSPITTHVLDTALGRPAHGLPLALLVKDAASGEWSTVGQGVTNADGRVGTLMPPSNVMPAGHYRMVFDTQTYLLACAKQNPGLLSDPPFYPECCVEFVVPPSKTLDHYHIPLLLSPYGYSTYKGS